MTDLAYILFGDDMKRKKLFCIRKILQLLFAVLAIIICLRYGTECSRGILNGILFCVEVLVPSLFLLMTIAAYLVKSGIAEAVAKPLNGVSKALFRLPYPSLAVILLALVGGYPVGARCAAIMTERGTLSEKQAQKTALIAVCAGPGFLINFIGRALLGSPEAGILLLITEVLATIVTGMIIGRAVKSEITPPAESIQKTNAHLLTASVADASRSTFHMCAMVVLCSAMIEVLTAVSPDRGLTAILSSVMEITSGCAVLCGQYPLALIAFFIGFGGISVHLQIFAATGSIKIKPLLFFLYRIIQGIIASVATYTLLLIFPIEVKVFNSADLPLTVAKSATLIGSAALVICSLFFSASVSKLSKRDS